MWLPRHRWSTEWAPESSTPTEIKVSLGIKLLQIFGFVLHSLIAIIIILNSSVLPRSS